MEVDPLEGSSYVLNEMLKIEIEMKVEEEEDINPAASDLDGSLFSTELMSDPTTGLVLCRLCLEEFPRESSTEHMVNIHKYRKVAFKCWNCETTFKDRIMLTFHRQNCQPKKKKKKTMQCLLKEAEESEENVCPICFIETPDLKEHIVNVHGKKLGQGLDGGEVNCPDCGKAFKSKVTMGQHNRLVHKSVQDSHECLICGVRFSSYKYLSNHTRNVHPSGDKMHKCESCGKEYKSRQSLSHHKKRKRHFH